MIKKMDLYGLAERVKFMNLLKQFLRLSGLGLVVTAMSAPVVMGQFPQMQKHEERRRQAIEAAEKREREEKGDASKNALPQPKPSLLNKNVRLILSGSDLKSFAEAEKAVAKNVKDGDNLWLYLKFDTKLGDYVRTVEDAENDGSYKYLLYADISPQNDPTVLAKYVIQFSREDLELKELKINLSPGLKGRNAAIPLFIDVAATRSPGIWNNQLRIANKNIVPRMPSDDLASADVTLNLTGRVTQYPRIRAEFDSMILRGTADNTVMPSPGAFYSLPLKTMVQNHLKEQGVMPLKFYFALDDWLEYGVSAADPASKRTMFAVFTYREKDQCLYGVAKLTQKMDMMTAKFSGDTIEITNDMKIPCSEVE